VEEAMLMVFLGWIALQLPLGIWLGKRIKAHQSLTAYNNPDSRKVLS
jgi:hypothetical protein